MSRPRAAALPIAGKRQLENVCPRAGCSNSFLQWMLCRHPECPPSAEPVDRATKKAREGTP